MTDDKHLAFAILQSLNYAILRRTAPGEYAFLGKAPSFYDKFFPPAAGRPCTTPWKHSAMMEFFLDEAEDFFEQGEAGSISTGVWGEDGMTRDDNALRATAANLDGEQVIIICLMQEDYAERLRVLRKAREQLQENRLLTTNLSIFREKSRIDGLTSIFNRTTFMELLIDEVKRSKILDYPLVLLILDIDDFKKVNDTYGHLVGDKILQGMGMTLKKSLRRNDIVARYGGEEFAVLMSHTPVAEASQVAEKIRVALATMDVPEAPYITVSIGCTAYLPNESPDGFFKRADDALYVAKKAGKNRVCVA